jgi:DNA-binding LacI/PurR family transcriptional regulator
VGYGDPVWFKLLGPGLTTVGLPVQEMGRHATGLLLSRFEQGAPPQAPRTAQVVRFPPALVVRGSTRPLLPSERHGALSSPAPIHQSSPTNP